MRNLSLIIILIFIAPKIYAQKLNYSDLNAKECTELINTWKRFNTGLELRNSNDLRKLSLKNIHCDLFIPDTISSTYQKTIARSYIPFNTFLTQFYDNEPKLKLWLVMKSKSYHIGESEITSPPNIKHKTGVVKLYDIWYITFEPNEIVKGSEGQSEGFEFVKINGKFIFYGLTSIP